MKIGIIGTGAIGGTIAKKMVAAGHQVKVYNTSSAEQLKAKARELGAESASINSVVKNVNIIILSTPTSAIPLLPKDLFAVADDDVIIVDTSNYYPFRDGDIEELKDGKVESVWVSEQIGRPVIKAFNNLLAKTLESGGNRKGAEGRIAMAISGDDKQAKETVEQLIDDAGYDSVDAGSLADSWKHQPGTPAYCTELNAVELGQALQNGIKETAAEIRDSVINQLGTRTSYPSHEEIVEFNRSLFSKEPKR